MISITTYCYYDEDGQHNDQTYNCCNNAYDDDTDDDDNDVCDNDDVSYLSYDFYDYCIVIMILVSISIGMIGANDLKESGPGGQRHPLGGGAQGAAGGLRL